MDPQFFTLRRRGTARLSSTAPTEPQMPLIFPDDTFFPVWSIPPPESGPETKKATDAADFITVTQQKLTVSRRMEKLSLEKYYADKNQRSSSTFDDWKEAQHFQVPPSKASHTKCLACSCIYMSRVILGTRLSGPGRATNPRNFFRP